MKHRGGAAARVQCCWNHQSRIDLLPFCSRLDFYHGHPTRKRDGVVNGFPARRAHCIQKAASILVLTDDGLTAITFHAKLMVWRNQFGANGVYPY